MTTDLIKTLEELQSIRGYWFPEHSKAYVDSLPQIISALKDAERMREAVKTIQGFKGCGCRPKCLCLSESALLIFRESVFEVCDEALATADTKESK